MEKRNLWHTLSADEILRSYSSTLDAGLTSLQAGELQAKYGRNVFSRKKEKSLWQRLAGALFEPMQLLLIASVVIALAVNVIRFVLGQETDFIECAGILIAIMLSVLITVLMEGKSAKAFEALNKWNSDSSVRVIRDGKVVLLPRSEVVTGDIVKLETGDKLPADGRLLLSSDLEVDESSLTGESVPVLKDAGFVADSADLPLAERKNMLYSGTYVTSGNGLMLVSAVGDATEFGKLAGELSGDDESQTPLQEKLAKLGGRIAIFGIVAAVVVFAVQTVSFILSGTASLENISNAFITSIVLIVACVPEGLPTIVAVALAISIIKMSRQKMLVKKLVACETAGSINLICSDKTGTLTENRMTVIKVWSNGEVFEPDAVRNAELLENLSVNSTADVYLENGTFRRVGNPTETALLGAAVSSGCDYRQLRAGVRVLHSYVFSSETKNMTTILEAGNGMKVLTKGSPEKILAMCDIAPDELKAAQQAIADFQSRAGRVIGFAHKIVENRETDFEAGRNELESHLIFDGFAVISDPLRKDVYAALSRCRNAGIDVKILTGDNLITARAIAGELDLLDDEHLAVEAAELEKLDDREFALILPKIRVIARSTPLVKLRVVKTLKALGNVVAVTGDGINDAPAIKNADIGVAMGITGTEVSKEAGDIVLLDDSFSTLVRAVHWGRGIYENFQRFIQFQLTVNLSSVVVVLVSTLCGLAAPFSALQLLWVNLIMDGPPALTLGLEPIRDDLMDRKPVNRNASIVTAGMLLSIFAGGVFISLVVLAQIFGNFLGAGDAEKSTVVFALFVIFQLFNAFNCRELNGSSLFANFTRNRLMLSVFFLTVIMQFAIIQWGGKVFKTVPLSGILWLKIILCAFSVIVFSEIAKQLLKMAGKRS